MSRVFPLQKWLSQVGSQVRKMEQLCLLAPHVTEQYNYSGALLQQALQSKLSTFTVKLMTEEGKEGSGYVQVKIIK